MWIFAKISDLIFFWELCPYRNLAKIKKTTETVCHHNSSETAPQISCNFLIKVDILYRSVYSQKILNWFFLREHRSLARMCETGLAHVHEFKWRRSCSYMFLTVNVQMLHQCEFTINWLLLIYVFLSDRP